MSQMLAFIIIVFILFVGDYVAIRTNAWVPSIFVCAVLFLIGYWTFFPTEIVATAGIPEVVATLLMFLLITNMGTLLSINELKKQWRTILIALTGILGAIVVLFLVGSFIFDLQTIIVAVPPLVGGIVSSLIMSEGAADAGLMHLSVFAIVIYVMQGFAGYPLTSIMLKREGKQLLAKYKNNELEAAVEQEEEIEEELKLFKNLPEKYNTSYFKFFRLGLVAFFAYLVSTILEPLVTVDAFVLCLVFGILAKHFGFLETQVMEKANGFGFAMLALLLFILDGLKNATPSMMLEIIYILIGCIVLGVIGMYIFSFIIGKLLKTSPNLAFAVTLTSLYGFPADYIITMEVINSLTPHQKERDVLTSHMLPPMLVGGFITVTIVSVILAGIFVQYI
ncbi:MAG TPA: hypothetical protein VK078_07215 [Pseudogracilibacillus sp.]|nr:hypothetical protein [Pseudogracilibacillus sp.]